MLTVSNRISEPGGKKTASSILCVKCGSWGSADHPSPQLMQGLRLVWKLFQHNFFFWSQKKRSDILFLKCGDWDDASISLAWGSHLFWNCFQQIHFLMSEKKTLEPCMPPHPAIRLLPAASDCKDDGRFCT